MFKQLVVGVDEHQGGRDAIALARQLLARDGDLTLAYVYAGDQRLYRSASPPQETSEHQHALKLLEKARNEAGGQAQLRWRACPSVGRGLHELCEMIEADLLVVGSSRRGLLGRVLIGDDTHAALHEAPCAVAIAPAGFAREPAAMQEVGVGYDRSPESERAVEVARELATEVGAQLSAFQAVSLPSGAFRADPSLVRDAIATLVNEARHRIAELGGVEPHVAYGHPAEELAAFSTSLDLLIVGARDYGPIGGLIHGSTSQQLARTARCPLLVLTRDTPVIAAPVAGEHEPEPTRAATEQSGS